MKVSIDKGPWKTVTSVATDILYDGEDHTFVLMDYHTYLNKGTSVKSRGYRDKARVASWDDVLDAFEGRAPRFTPQHMGLFIRGLQALDDSDLSEADKSLSAALIDRLKSLVAKWD